jgi:hypothetical protein
MYVNKVWEKLSDLNEYQLRYFLDVLDIKTDFQRASELGFTKKKSDLVLEHCKRFDADICFTGCHGKDYIVSDDFKREGISLYFQEYVHPKYDQLWGEFVPYMSVIDLLFNCGPASKDIIMSGNVGSVK